MSATSRMTRLSLALLLLLCGRPAASASEAEGVPGMKNPSVRIMLDQTRAVPTSGSFGWGMAMFRVEAGSGVSLTALDARLRSALQSGFTRKGFAYAEDEPDYLVSYALAAGAELDEAELNREYGDLLRLPAAEPGGADELHFKRGALIVDLVDREAKHLIWRGAILAEIDMTWPDARKQERCDAAVAQLMRSFPKPPEP